MPDDELVLVAVIDENGMLTGVGRAPKVAIAKISGAKIKSIEEIEVKWNNTHENEPEGLHHANVARFLREHHTNVLLASGAGFDMRRMIEKLGIKFYINTGDYRSAIESFINQ
ncbi:MAG: NifB/NifX family molybdenum-iron cluster-binding protein [Candidatus Micrarchaeia archaeon]